MSKRLIDQVRHRLPLYLTPEVGAAAGLSLDELRQIIAQTFVPTDEQLETLARRMNPK
jgi:hypothetical protein